METALLAILICYQGMMSILDVRDIKRLTSIEITEKIRIKYYKDTIIFGWIPVLIVLICIPISQLNLQGIGFRRFDLSDNIWLNVITLIFAGILTLVLLYQIVMYLSNEKYRDQIKNELDSKKEAGPHYDAVISKILIPKSATEKRWFFFVSLTAGICEETVWRGCILFLLSNMFPSVNMIMICAISCVLFGLAHSYQGLHGIIKTSLIAILFVLIYVATNSIFPGIVLHFFFDFSSAFLIKEERRSLH